QAMNNATLADAATAGAPRYQVLDRAPVRWSDRLLRWETILLILLVAVVIFNTVLSPYFLDVYNLSDTTQNFSEKAIVALGMALPALAMGLAMQAGAGPAELVLISLGVGALCGAFNGALVTAFGLPAIVVTIGTMSLYRGIAQVVLGDTAITTYPPEFTEWAQ